MPQPLSHESRALLQLLDDGEWHPLDQIKDQLCGKVPPWRALRAYNTKERSRERTRGPRTNPELLEDEAIKSGKNTLVNSALHSMSRRHVEIEDRGIQDGRFIRVRLDTRPVSGPPPAPSSSASGTEQDEGGDPDPEPACLHCGAGALRGPPVVADEARLRDLVADEVAREIAVALDAFQDGMQRYLDRQFADLGRRRPKHQEQRLPPPLRRR